MKTSEKTTTSTTGHNVSSREDWLAARKELLKQEKAYTHQRDALSEARRALPWVRVDKEYVFDGPKGKQTLSDLFDGRSQLIIQHFMLGPGWEEGCTGCSFLADHVDGPMQHIKHHDVTFTAVARAPWPEIEKFQKRMDWKFPWVSSFGSDFNYDYHVSYTKEDEEKGEVIYNFETVPFEIDELHGFSVFYKDTDGAIYHTYSTYARGGEALLGAYALLDMTPIGRNETSAMSWVKLHDQYNKEESTCGSSCGCGNKEGKS